jgi:hypothetical protein
MCKEMNKYILILMLSLGITVSAQNLTIHGSDPTEIRSRIDIVLAQLTSLANSQFLGTTVLGEYAFNDWFLAGLDVPYVYARFEGKTSTGFGDVRLKLLASIYRAEQFGLLKAVAGGIDVHLDTGDADRGTGIGQTIVIPNIAASMQLAEEFLIIPRIRYFFSVKEHRDEIDEIRLDVDNVLAFPEEFWLSVMPELIIDIKGIRQTTLNMQTTLGKMLSDNWGIAAVFRTNLAGEPRVESRSHLSFRYLF